MLLTELNIIGFTPYSKDMEVADDSHFLSGLFIRLLGKYKTKETGKVVIIPTPNEISEQNGFPLYKGKARLLLNTIEFYVDFDYENYFTLKWEQRTEVLWELIYASFIAIANQLRWDIAPLQTAYKKGKEMNYQNTSVLFEGKRNPLGYAGYSVIADFKMKEVSIELILHDSKGIEQKKFSIAKKDPSWGTYDLPFLKKGKLAWNNDVLEIKYANRDPFLMNSDDPEIRYKFCPSTAYTENHLPDS